MIATMLAEAWGALIANRLRSMLTMLGMIIGVAAVILMLAIGGGVQKEVQKSISGLGSNLLIVTAGAGRQGGIFGGAGSGASLRIEDADAIAGLPDVKAAAPSTSLPAQAVAGPANWATNVTGSTPAYFLVNEWQAGDGRIFTDREERAGARVAVLGQSVADKLFGANDPIGQMVRVRGISFTVIGLLEKRGQGFGGQDRDDVIVVPLTSALRLLGGNFFRRSIRTVSVSVASAEALDGVQDDITTLLRRTHRLRSGEVDDFQVANLTAITDTLSTTTRAISLLLAAIGSISLVVGGIGIMNIMLVSVTERTREIGIRMAIGASRAAVRLQFLLEALMLSLIGCGIGVALGAGIAFALSGVIGFDTDVTVFAVTIAFAVSASIGIFFGWWPATRAAKLSPIEALRS
ncbi:ABC transporter permease [Sandarakinorhabdus sp.]|uniref:ABC transporter permease n=1 Tax=Sandarakinorhabdus sp. TaxID=1916663 RepID=UPI00286DF2F2|nr:ABC transporter permease [Sandarakinorhabdus sp.]